MSTRAELEAELEAERSKRDELETKVLAEAGSWVRSQADHINAFFRDEGRLTVVNQSEVTESISEKIPELRQRVERISDEAAQGFLAIAGALSPVDAQEIADDPRGKFNILSTRAASDFAEVFLEAGYSPNDLRVSRDWDGHYPWQFYVPSTGTARTEHIPADGVASVKLELLAKVYKESKWRITSLEAAVSKANAASLWGE